MSTCNICLNEIEVSEISITYCNHHFCKNCICTWVNLPLDRSSPPTCPTCRNDIKDKYARIFYFTGYPNNISKIINKDTETRFYLNRQIKYKIFVDSKSNYLSGKFYNSSGGLIPERTLNISLINNLRHNENYLDQYFK